MPKTMLMGAAALTAIRLTDGRRANISAGRAVPENIDPDDAKRLLAEGFLVEVEIVDQVVQVDADVIEPEGPNPPAPARRGNPVPTGLTFDDVADAAAVEAARAAGEPDPGTDPGTVPEVVVETDPFTDEQLAELPTTVDGLLDEVGDNPVKAQQVLDAELEKPEDKRRKTLVSGLQDVLDAAEAADQGDGEEQGQ